MLGRLGKEPYGGEGAGRDELGTFLSGRKMKSGGVAGAGEVSIPR